MSDRYLELVNSSYGRSVAGRIGLPRPSVLRRFEPGAPLLPGPAVLGRLARDGGLPGLAALLTSAGVEVAAAGADGQRPAALIFDATPLSSVGQLGEVREFLASGLTSLRGGGRVVIIARTPDGAPPAVAAARAGIGGVVRSLAKELRGGATANGILLSDDQAGTPQVQAPLRFLLSGRSAYVDGQFIEVSGGPVTDQAWEQPLAGKVALVTGAARGIGAAIASVLARDGATVIAADLPAAGQALAAVANTIGGTTLQLDIASDQAARTIVEHTRSRFGGLDIVVHNAGITRDKLLVNMTAAQWDSVLAVNLESQLRVNTALLDLQGLNQDGRIVGLASTSGIAGNRGQTNYAASKAGVIAMTRAFAPLLASTGATINAIAPGFIDTDMTQHMPFATREVARRLNSLQQAGLPVDVAEAVSFLSWPGSGAVSGQVLRVCGQNLVGA